MYGRWCKYVFIFIFERIIIYLSPITIGAQLSIPLAIIISSIFFLNEKISYKKWILIFTSFLGIILIAFDPKIVDEILGALLIFAMAFFYGLSQVFSRYLKDFDVKFTNSMMGLIGFLILIILSGIFEGNIIKQI